MGSYAKNGVSCRLSLQGGKSFGRPLGKNTERGLDVASCHREQIQPLLILVGREPVQSLICLLVGTLGKFDRLFTGFPFLQRRCYWLLSVVTRMGTIPVGKSVLQVTNTSL